MNIKRIVAFFRQAHPFAYTGLVFALMVQVWWFRNTGVGADFLAAARESFYHGVLVGVASAGFLVAGSYLVGEFFYLYALAGKDEGTMWTQDPDIVGQLDSGERLVLLTYTDAFRWALRPFGKAIRLVTSGAWRHGPVAHGRR